MTAYSFNQGRLGVVLSRLEDINASYKDLCAVCDAIRYKSAGDAMRILDSVGAAETPVAYRRHNRYMGSRHELGGVKGRWPSKCARIVQKVLRNAMAAAKAKGVDVDSAYVVHAAANKTIVARRTPPKGILVFGAGRYGRGSTRFSDLEFAKVELGISADYDKLSKRIKDALARAKKLPVKKPEKVVKAAAKKVEKPKQVPTVAKPEKAEVAKPVKAETAPAIAPESA